MGSPEVPQLHNPKALAALKPTSSSSMSSLSSVLTEERLREHNRRPSRAASPYYYGLTHSGLYLRSLGHRPSRESVASSPRSSSSSSALLMIQFLRSIIKKEVDGGELQRAPPPAVPKTAPRGGGSCSGSRRPLRESKPAPCGGGSGSGSGSGSRRPLRESKPAPAPAQQPVVAAPVAQQHVSPPTVAIGGAVRKDRDFVWAYKYRPMHLKDFICNRDRVEELEEMVRKQQCNHLICEGPPGVGKRTMVLAFLRDVLELEKLKTKNELRKIELKGEHISSIDVNVKVSSQHVEVNMSELRGYEKHVLVSLINESRAPSDKSVPCDHSNCRAIVVHEAHRLSTDAQHYLRWVMEKYKGCNKIFFSCCDASKLQTIKQFCKIVKLQQPSDSEIVEVLELIAKKEHVELPHHLADKIAKNSKNNLRQAIRSFEASWKANHSIKDDNNILTGWEDDIANIAKSVVKEQSPKQLYMIHGMLKKLIEHDVSPEFICDNLLFELKKLLDKQFHDKIDAMYQECRIRDSGPIVSREKSAASSLDRQEDSSGKSNDQRRNVQYFMWIEEFTAKFMSYYKSFIIMGTGASG